MAQAQTKTDPKLKISKAKSRLIMDHPFFGTLLLRTEVLVTDKLPGGEPLETAATDGERMYFSPDFLDLLSIEEVMFVLCHEVGHDSLLHSMRLGLRNHEMWNHACDHAINLMLINQKLPMPKAVPGLCDEQFRGWAADRIYDHMRRNQPPPNKGGKSGQGKPGGGNGKPNPNSAQPGNTLAGDVRPSRVSQDPAAQAAAEQRAKQKVASAANMARMAGKLHGDLERMVGEFLEAKVPWTEVLRDFMLKVVKSRDSWARRNRRFDKFFLPTRHGRKMGPIILIPDTSYSMWGDDMEKICSEMAHCATQTQPENIRVLWADTKVQGEQVFTADEFEFSKLVPKGGGGTNMCVPLAYAERYEPQVVVLLTDGETPWPDAEPPFPLIVICTTGLVAPIGTTINI